MAEAYTSVSDDLYGLYYNPAGMTNIKREFTCMYYQQSDANISYGLIGYGQNIKNIGVLASSLLFYDAGKIEWQDSIGNISNFNLQRDYLFTLGFCRETFKNVYLGINTKYYYSTMIEKYSATAYAIDTGILYKTPIKRLSVGTVLQNTGTPIKYISYSDPMPTTIRFGIAYKLKLPKNSDLTVAFDILKPNDNIIKKNAGIEYFLNNTIALRGGYKFGYDLENYSMGFGLKLTFFEIDYSVITKRNFDSVHILSFTLQDLNFKNK
ncbi:MAG: hypothetical protein A2474_04705 [Elusimicrobia bacterium RIFOXYC2_FULL_34_12]|nr:MAG: hypothetical protein A2474_04705 [Elusimicrobia bacterium RIFOXYC2_FULL_34_12]OGS38056.1 MAG: hypothetical protein A2551_01325 [Elusimicrobia bacterium RIFOXYD2_FULL_34_30]HAM39319.1 hypothetical protein [Elusimicrobiota bacterium]